MTTTAAQRDRWTATIRSEGDRLAAMPAELLDAPVPTVDDWTLERVIRHVGKVHRWVTGLLAAPADVDPAVVARAAPSLPKGPACLPAYRDALDELLDAFAGADPDRAVASFAGDATVAFWLRRQAHEVAVHRIDAADAVYGTTIGDAVGPTPAPLDRIASADGVAEWLEVFAAGSGDPAAPITFRVTDVDRADGAVEWTLPPATGPDADVVVSGAAEALLLTLWRRRPLAAVDVTGDPARVVALLDAVRI